jgi:hypothetical protein
MLDTGFRVKKIPDPGSGNESKNTIIFSLKNCFKAIGKMIWDVHHPGPDIFPTRIPDSGVKRHQIPDPLHCFLCFQSQRVKNCCL